MPLLASRVNTCICSRPQDRCKFPRLDKLWSRSEILSTSSVGLSIFHCIYKDIRQQGLHMLNYVGMGYQNNRCYLQQGTRNILPQILQERVMCHTEYNTKSGLKNKIYINY